MTREPIDLGVTARVLAAHGITCSMSRAANCQDNAAMEPFFSSLKSGLADRFASCVEATMALFDYIEVVYNQRRRHSTIGYVSPAAFGRAALGGRESAIGVDNAPFSAIRQSAPRRSSRLASTVSGAVAAGRTRWTTSLSP